MGELVYCNACGGQLVDRVPDNDNRTRRVCRQCDRVHYSNPRIIASCLAHYQNRIVWMQRAEEPQRGHWVIPAGFMESGESLREAAARELAEETGARVDVDAMMLYTMGDLMYTNEVYVVFRAPLTSDVLVAGDEALDVKLFGEADAPWDEIAYPVMEPYIRRFYQELESNSFTLYLGEFRQSGNWIQDLATGLR